MSRKQNKQTFKLQILALVLAVALLWYSINPAPSPIKRNKPKDEPADEKRRELEPQLRSSDAKPASLKAFKIDGKGASAAIEDEDDFKWPEFIDA